MYFTVCSPLEVQAPCSLSPLSDDGPNTSEESVSPASNGMETVNLLSDAGAGYPESHIPVSVLSSELSSLQFSPFFWPQDLRSLL